MWGSQSLIRDYIALTKPRILSMLLLTALCAMFLATDGVPEITLIVWVLVGGALAAGGAHSLNHYIERDTDSLMRRTRKRPVASGRISPREALWFGVILNVIAFVLLIVLVNPLTSMLTLSATLFYVFVYTIGLKRSTPQNIVIGGAAGAVPPMAAWAAVTNSIELPAIYLFAIIFFWTPPHFWALAIMIKDDYARAGIPMLPVVRGIEHTTVQIMLYSVILSALTILFGAVSEPLGWIYMIGATVLCLAFIWYALLLTRNPEQQAATRLYKFSLLYLALFFVLVMVDSVVT